ncbi:uncharacterized protein A1O9_03345 [Exophiala aquamarina CBS 119918]|uniref:Uncharacterized protein n=1 Tax=Exophiala aquamarina CBS 119918 TaxID=1182545 RepID=A0A072Q1P4_9EURO|nr:uncharacterized protein A1O9_03345 [Exophiala aquamarina CBS 119918]KEF61775.1 hypothetical protein A1O9_03345 [Exophiala aquamarina CBS 119918]
MQLKKYIPDFLLPTDEPQAPVRIYDVPVHRGLFQKAQPGNKQAISSNRNNSVASTVSERSQAYSRTGWRPGMAFRH